MEMLVERFPNFSQMNIVDLGGDTRLWRAAAVRPEHVTIVDIASWALGQPESWMTVVQGDACDARTISGQFDMVFSNSVIEHVGGPRFRRGFAETVDRLSDHHWVQTPYRYFPLEPHLLFPGFQFLPPAAKVNISQRWPLSHMAGRQDVDHVKYVMDHDLLTITEIRSLFPGSDLLRERAGGLVKSLIVVH
jgi:hypothetical protein